MSDYENEVFDATVGDYVRKTLTGLGNDLGESAAVVVPALEATEVEIHVSMTVFGSGKAEFQRRTRTLVWRSKEELEAMEAEMEKDISA